MDALAAPASSIAVFSTAFTGACATFGDALGDRFGSFLGDAFEPIFGEGLGDSIGRSFPSCRRFLPFRPRTSGIWSFGASAASDSSSSTSPASVSSSLIEPISLTVSPSSLTVLSVSPASDTISLSLVPAVSEPPLAPVSEAAEDEASEWYFLRSRNFPVGRARRQIGKAGESVDFIEILWMGLSSCRKCLVTCAITAHAFAERSASSIATLPNLTPRHGPNGILKGVPAITFFKCSSGAA
mmetsp:Transcript_19417/g.53315  ORF Transcript_19417/g.53315 Transcript_19417/m.53315 type:complete len:241 (-) Transcript_19417:555-1277(-)